MTKTTPKTVWFETLRKSGNLALKTGIVGLGGLIGSGCSVVDYKRVTYDLLRQQDCRENNLQEFCSQTYLFEYDEYERLRQDYLRSQSSDSYYDFETDPVTKSMLFN